MTHDLHIEFSGLCAFSAEGKAQDAKSVNVLMPESREDQETPVGFVPSHFATLVLSKSMVDCEASCPPDFEFTKYEPDEHGQIKPKPGSPYWLYRLSKTWIRLCLEPKPDKPDLCVRWDEKDSEDADEAKHWTSCHRIARFGAQLHNNVKGPLQPKAYTQMTAWLELRTGELYVNEITREDDGTPRGWRLLHPWLAKPWLRWLRRWFRYEPIATKTGHRVSGLESALIVLHDIQINRERRIALNLAANQPIHIANAEPEAILTRFRSGFQFSLDVDFMRYYLLLESQHSAWHRLRVPVVDIQPERPGNLGGDTSGKPCSQGWIET